MQKLDRRNTYTPPDTTQVRCNSDSVLKVPRGKDGVLSLKTLSNNSDEYLLQSAGGDKSTTLVYVLNKNDKPLMPCKPAKANFLSGGRLKRNTVKEVKGFKRFDKVKFDGKEGIIHGLRSSGYFDVRSISGDKLGASVNSKKLTLLERAKGIITQAVRGPFPPRTEVRGLHSPCTPVI